MSRTYDEELITQTLREMGEFSDDEIIMDTLAGPDKPRCGVCGLPYHRYSTGDPEHDFDAVACVNGLLFRMGILVAEITRLREIVNE